MKEQQIGWFVTLEGGEGGGKTSAIGPLKERLMQQGLDVIVTREPGGVRIAEKIRDIILNPEYTEMDIRTEALLYAAARRQHFIEVVIPALKHSTMVLCDRFIDSSLAYQGYVRDIGMKDVWEINRFAIHNTMPDITFWLDIDPQVGLDRIVNSDLREVNRLDKEQFAFHQAVRDGYRILAKQHSKRIVYIDAAQTIEQVVDQMFHILYDRTQKFAIRTNIFR